jgi:predicted dehydrogenase
MIVYDDLEPSEKVKVYDRGITVNGSAENVYKMLIDYRIGDMWAPRLDTTEALYAEARHFIRCIESGERPMSDGEAGLKVVQILEAATQSMADRGQPVELGARRVLV